MLIVALVLAVIGLAALVTAVVTNNELIAWVCIGASGIGVLLLIVDAIRERSQRRSEPTAAAATATAANVIAPATAEKVMEPVETTAVIEDEIPSAAAEFEPEETAVGVAVEDHPDELVYDEPDYDTPSDDEAEFPEPAEEAAIHTVGEEYLARDSDDDRIDDSVDLEAEDAEGAEGAEEADEVEDAEDADEYATEIRYSPSAEGSADTVVYIYAEGTETESTGTESTETDHIDAEGSVVNDDQVDDDQVNDDRGDQ